MKTIELKLKKDMLIVDAENGFNHFKIYDDEIGFIFIENGIPRKELVKGSYKFLCKCSELTEEIASELVDYWQNMANDGFIFENYKDNIPKKLTAIKSFISAVESKEKFWLENPIKHPKDYEVFPDSLSLYTEQEKLHFEAEEKTFKNPLIFVKK